MNEFMNDWADAHYFDAGIQAAMLVENLLGPLPSAPTDTLPFNHRLQLINPEFDFLAELDEDDIDQGIADL